VYKHGHRIELYANCDLSEELYANGKPECDVIYRWKNGAVYKCQLRSIKAIKKWDKIWVWVYGT
jgi:hypothetical protein